MTLRPNAAELLHVARKHLLDELLPAIPSHLRYQTLMVANAMAISAREYQLGACNYAEEVKTLNGLLGEDNAVPENARRSIASAIRAGQYDALDARRDGLAKALMRITLAQLSISNPKVMP